MENQSTATRVGGHEYGIPDIAATQTSLQEPLYACSSKRLITGPLKHVQRAEGRVGDIIIVEAEEELYSKPLGLFLWAVVCRVGTGREGT